MSTCTVTTAQRMNTRARSSTPRSTVKASIMFIQDTFQLEALTAVRPNVSY